MDGYPPIQKGTNMLKKVGRAFLTGGCIGVVGEALIQLASLLIPDATVSIMVGVLLFGIVAVALILSGVYFKIAEYGGDGAAIPVCGLMFGAATGAAASEAAGESKGKAFLTGFLGVIKVLGTGYILAFLLGLLWH